MLIHLQYLHNVENMICAHQINEMVKGEITTKVTLEAENNAKYVGVMLS